MTRDPLISTETDELTRALLASAQNDEPSAAAYAKVAAALGVAAPAAVASLAPVAAAGAASRWSLPAALKGLGFVVASGAIIGGALLYRAERDRVSAAGQLAKGRVAARAALAPQRDTPPELSVPSPAPAAVAVVSAARASGPSDESSAGEPSPTSTLGALAPAPVAPEPASARARPASAGVAKPTSAAPAPAAPTKPAVVSSLSEQVMALDRVRVALSANHPADALREIASYRTHYAKGVFLLEASVLEIEALAAAGERPLAAAKAEAFLEAHPDSSHAARLRALVPKRE